MVKEEKEKPRVRVGFILFWIIAASVIAFYSHILFFPRSPFLPRSSSYEPFERHYHLSTKFPFITSYFLMLPEDYDPEQEEYPLVMMLHGVSRHMYAGSALKHNKRRKKYRVIAYIPIAPPVFTWVNPFEEDIKPEALPVAMEILESLKQEYSVDENRIYITGYSMGGVGTYAALERYKDVFAAAAPVAGAWLPEKAYDLDDIPIWIFQGAKDPYAPLGRAVYSELKQFYRNVKFTDYPTRGHSVWGDVYEDNEFWDWLVTQER